ncbi:MAG: hypothetical protein WDM91_11210 [Rhizomicrobium sp.]
MADVCAAGVPIGSGPCPVCDATEDNDCGGMTPAAQELARQTDKIREHFSILQDGPARYVLADNRSDDPCPVYVTLCGAMAALETRLAEEVNACGQILADASKPASGGKPLPREEAVRRMDDLRKVMEGAYDLRSVEGEG